MFKYSSCKKPFDQFEYNLVKCFFGDILLQFFKPSRFVKKHGHQAAGLISLYIYMENVPNILVRKHWTDFNITWQIGFFGDPPSRLFKNMAARGLEGGGLIFPIYLFRKLQNKICQYVNIIRQQCFFGDTLTRMFKSS